VGVEGDAVDDGGDEAGVGEDGAPFAEGQVGGDGDGGAFFAFGDDLEEQFGSPGVDVDVAEFVEAEQVEAAVAADDPGQDSFVGGFDEFVDQLGGGGVADASARPSPMRRWLLPVPESPSSTMGSPASM